MTQQVHVEPLDIEQLATIVGGERQVALRAAAQAARSALAGRVIVHVNATATGGGVAELLPPLLGYSRGVGIDARWSVISGNPQFFAVTKRLHNLIHGYGGECELLGPAERTTYQEVLAAAGLDLLAILRAGDVAVLHDPQTLGLAPRLHHMGIKIIWRCHIGSDSLNASTAQAWQFLEPYLSAVDRFVFSRAAHRPPNVPEDRTHVITPSLDPLSAKNRPMADSDVTAVLAYTGLLQGEVADPPASPVVTDHRPGWSTARTSFSSAHPSPQTCRWLFRYRDGIGSRTWAV